MVKFTAEDYKQTQVDKLRIKRICLMHEGVWKAPKRRTPEKKKGKSPKKLSAAQAIARD